MPNFETIAVRAYQIWEADGRPDGRDMEHWSSAEAELSLPPIEASPRRPVAVEAPPSPPEVTEDSEHETRAAEARTAALLEFRRPALGPTKRAMLHARLAKMRA